MKYQFALALTGVGLFLSCGKGDKKSSGGGDAASNIDIKLKSSQLSTAGLVADLAAASSCQVAIDATMVSGTCYTPIEVLGSYNKGTLESSFGGPPIRIFGGGSSASGPADIFGHLNFNLKTSPSSAGEDNIQDGTAESYNYLKIHAQYVEFAFEATPANKVYHVRTFFVDNKPSDDAVLSASSCRVSSAITEADSIGTLFAGIDAKARDIMVCAKSSSTETCTDADYQWVESNGTLASTRPASPKQQPASPLITASTCPSDGANWGYGALNIGFATAQSLKAKFEEGKKIYTANGSSGEKLNFTIDIDLSGGLFVPASTGITDLALANETAVLANISDIMLKPMYVSKTRTGMSGGDTNSMLSGTPTFTVE